MGPKRHFKKNWYRMPIVRFYWNAGAPVASVAVCQGCSRKRVFGLSCVSEDCGRTCTNLTRIATSLVFLTTFFWVSLCQVVFFKYHCFSIALIMVSFGLAIFGFDWPGKKTPMVFSLCFKRKSYTSGGLFRTQKPEMPSHQGL